MSVPDVIPIANEVALPPIGMDTTKRSYEF
jgi:hypothetical protein